MIHANKCPICLSPATIHVRTMEDGQHIIPVECIRCGDYSQSNDLEVKYPLAGLQLSERAKISAWLYHHPQTIVSSQQLKHILKSMNPTVGTRADALLIALARRAPIIGSNISRLYTNLAQTIRAIQKGDFNTTTFNSDAAGKAISILPQSWSSTPDEITYLLQKYLVVNGYLESPENDLYQITPIGWKRIHELENESINSMQGFVAMDFAEKLKPIFFHAIRPGIEGAGYRAQILHDHQHNNWIADEIMAQIRRSRFVVADVSTHNQGVYFEAGFALGLGIPVIWICTQEEFKKRHFDAAQINTIKYSEVDLPGLVNELKHRIINTITKK